ncbi:MAG: PKD domain-containing protein [Bacteroidales bacterium]|nr:PKD domain-containing protein [Bacteroidales bacterium]
MKYILLAIITIITPITLLAQNLVVTLTANNNNDTIKICKNKAIEFIANASINGEPVNAEFSWDFDDGTIINKSSTNTINHAFSKGGSYITMVKAVYNDYYAYSKITVLVGNPPSFSRYKTSIPESQTGICLGESVTLNLPTNDTTLFYKPITTHTELIEQSLFNKEWTSFVRLKTFDNKNITTGAEIKSVTIKMDHENSKDVKITLACPNNKEIVLKDYSTNEGYMMGLPSSKGFGTLYNYTFIENGNNTINNTTLNQNDTVLPAGNYKTEQSFSELIGCPINGDWTIKVSSQGTANEGYAIEFSLNLDNSILEQSKWEYNQTYDLKHAVWVGKGVSATSEGECKVTPQEYDVTRYNFSINDNFNCYHDTTIYITVEKPTFEGVGDSTTFIGDEVNFNSTTSWGNNYIWIFGDKTPNENINPAPHAYYDKGVFKIIFQAESAFGCIDRDTQNIEIVPRPLEIKEVNIFTPNQDGQNDVFTFFNKDESFLESGGLTKMPANISSIKGKIYNSYGQTVYKWDEIIPAVFGWDGTVDNKGNRDCPPGTYYYDIIVYGKDGNNIKRSGTIYLYREK